MQHFGKVLSDIVMSEFGNLGNRIYLGTEFLYRENKTYCQAHQKIKC